MRVYKRRTNRESISEEVIKAAINMVLKNREKKGFSIRSVAKLHKINYTTLSRYIKKCKPSVCQVDDDETSDCDEDLRLEWKKIPGQVFAREHEGALIDYINRCSRINCGLRPKHTRSLAYQYAIKTDINRPTSWDKNKQAGEDWLTSFLRRNERLLPFSAQAMRSRTASFNKFEAKKFYERLKELYDKHKFTSNNIYNMEETCVSTIVLRGKAPSSQKIVKQNDCIETVEKSGESVSVAIAANAAGELVPPMLIFPRKKYHQRFVQDGPIGCIGAGNPTGAMTDETFLTFLKHFVKHAKPNDTNPVLLIIDNSTAMHLSILALDFCDNKGLTLLSLPPHSTQKLQPLNVTVTSAFKEYCKISLDDWTKRYLGRKMTVHDLPSIIKEPLIDAMTPANIILGFAKTAIYPLRMQNFDVEIVASHFLTENEMQQGTTTVNNLPMEYPDFGHLM